MSSTADGSSRCRDGAVAIAALFRGTVVRPLIAVGLLCAATYVVQEAPWRYLTVVEALVTGPSPQSPAAGWQETAEGVEMAVEAGRPVLRLTAPASGGLPAVRAHLPLPEGLDGVRVVVEAKADRMVPGPERWQTGRVQINSYDAQGRLLWYWPRDVVEVSGDTGWRHVETVIATTGDLGAVFVLIYNGALSGVMTIRDLDVAGVVERPAFAVLRAILIAAWALLGLCATRALVRGRRHLAARALLLALAAVALLGTLTPQPYFQRASVPIESLARSWLTPSVVGVVTSSSESGEVATEVAPLADGASSNELDAASRDAAPPAEGTSERLNRRGRPEPKAYEPTFKQAGHFAVFAALAIALVWAFPEVPLLVRAIYLLVFALVTECLQLFLITRGASLADLAVDLAGIALASGLFALVRRVRAATRRASSSHASRGSGP